MSSLQDTDSPALAHGAGPGNVHPLALATAGTTASEVGLGTHERLGWIPEHHRVPFLWFAVDTLPYDDHIRRHLQNGWPEDLVREALPRSRYFHVESRFAPDFDFESSLNRELARLVFDPRARRILKQPDAPGGSGIPLIAWARGQTMFDDMVDFIEPLLRDLARAQPGNLGLRAGTRVKEIVTYRGATGIGLALLLGAAIRIADPDAEIDLRALLPDIWPADLRARANAYAALAETRHVHRFGGEFPLLGGRRGVPPLNTVTPVGPHNGSGTMQGPDAIAECVAVLTVHGRAPTQAIVNASSVDLADRTPFDLNDLPTHVRQETAAAIRVAHPEKLDYLATRWVYAEVQVEERRLEAYLENGELSAREEERVASLVASAVEDLGLSGSRLLTRLDGDNDSANRIRRYFEQANERIASMQAADVKEAMPAVIDGARRLLDSFGPVWEEHVFRMAGELPREVAEHLWVRSAEHPVEYLEAQLRVMALFGGLADSAVRTAAARARERDAIATQLGEVLGEVQGAGGVLGVFRRDEVARDAAGRALAVAVGAAHRRREQEMHERLGRALRTGLTRTERDGREVVRRGIVEAMELRRTERIGLVRELHAARGRVIDLRLKSLRHELVRHSALFERDLVFEGLDADALAALVDDHRETVPRPEPIIRYLRSEDPDPGEVIAALRSLLPRYAETQQTLTGMLEASESRLAEVVEQLRNIRPFTPIDRVVEDQQGLRGRRDTLRLLELPGGKTSPLAGRMIQERIVPDGNHIVDSGDDEIRLYLLREGLPYEVLSDVKRLRREYLRYLENPAVITPHTLAEGHLLPEITPPKTNLRQHVEELILTARAVMPERFEEDGIGRITFTHTRPSGHRIEIQDRITVAALLDLTPWLAREVIVRKRLEEDLRERRAADAAAYANALLAAFHAAPAERERERLREVLFSLDIDPARWPVSTNGNSGAKGLQATVAGQIEE